MEPFLIQRRITHPALEPKIGDGDSGAVDFDFNIRDRGSTCIGEAAGVVDPLHRQYDANFVCVEEFSQQYNQRGKNGFGSTGK